MHLRSFCAAAGHRFGEPHSDGGHLDAAPDRAGDVVVPSGLANAEEFC